ncbi:MAG: hypothetical protein NW237_16090 [Cyanobacteriota bacterium]|nr:hypothetical protein [Cyanobacteriota bacterium]
MERGVLWLPLLFTFSLLAGLGWVEYRKVEAYREWAKAFDRSKYDLESVLGWQGSTLTWGKPAHPQPQAMQTLDLTAVNQIQLQVDQQIFDWPLLKPPKGRKIVLLFLPQQIGIPFSQIEIAVIWWGKLREAISRPG